MNLVSQSEADTFLSCQQKHYYSFGEPNSDGGRGIQPIEHSESLTRGIMGHEGIAVYWQWRVADSTHNEAVSAAIRTIVEYDTELIEVKSQVVKILGVYFEFYRDDFDIWKPLAIEKEFRYEFPASDITFPFKPDAVMQNRRTGQVVIWDHKFLYNYYQERLFPLMPQMKKYGLALKKLGFRIDGYMYNQISTRANSKQPFKRTEIFPLGDSAEMFMSDQQETSERIVELKTLGPVEWQYNIVRNASSFSCSHCPFSDLCISDVEGMSGRKLLIRNFYMPNSYRYGDGEEV